MDARHRLGSNVTRLRKAAGLTQEVLAGRADLHPTYLSGIEGAHRNPSVTAVEKLAAALRVDISELFSQPSEL